jgi:transglutaminase/protease-like cytokinesis protein 3
MFGSTTTRTSARRSGRGLGRLVLLLLTGCTGPVFGAREAMPPPLPRPVPELVHQPTQVPASDVLPAVIHPVVEAMPASAETSIEAVAHYIAAREPDRRLRIKALHDWVADRVSYAYADLPSNDTTSPFEFSMPKLESHCEVGRALCPPGGLEEGHPPILEAPPTLALSNDLVARGIAAGEWGARVGISPRAERAFVRRMATCAGYAALLHELGEAIGENIAYVTGKASWPSAAGVFSRHAWNVADTGRGYEPVDVTWDRVDDIGSSHRYSTEWLFMLPSEFVETHRPDDATWSLGVGRPVELADAAGPVGQVIQEVARRW